MNWLDVVILIIIALATLMGLWLGLIKAVLVLAGIIVGVLLAGYFYLPLSHLLSFLPGENTAKIVAFIIILVLVLLIAVLLAVFLKWLASLVMLGWLNHLGGAVFGLLLGMLFCGAILAMWVKFLGIGETIADSALAMVLLDRFPLVLMLLPGEFDAVRAFFQ